MILPSAQHEVYRYVSVASIRRTTSAGRHTRKEPDGSHVTFRTTSLWPCKTEMLTVSPMSITLMVASLMRCYGRKPSRLRIGIQLTQMRPQSAFPQDLRKCTEYTPQHSWLLPPPCLGLPPYTVVHQSPCFQKTTRYSVGRISKESEGKETNVH
jgi:hypothetical protein